MNRHFASLALLALAGISSAQIAYSSLAPDDTYNSAGAYNIGHASSSENWRQSFRFTSATTGFLEEFRFAIGHRAGSNGFIIEIMSDNAGEPGAALITIGTFADPHPGSIKDPTGIQTILGRNILLTAGESYWFEFWTATADGHGSMYLNDEGESLTWRASTDGDRTWEISNTAIAPAFEVLTIVPEPASFVALGLGAAAILRRRRKK